MRPPPEKKSSSAGTVVSAVGMVSPVGADAAQTFTSVRAGLRRMRELPAIYACQPEDARLDPAEPLVGSAIYHLDTALRAAGEPVEWLAFLAAQAWRDLERRARLEPTDLARVGIFLALPARPGLGREAIASIAYHFHNYAERDLFPVFHVAFGGQSAGLALAELAMAALRERRLDAAAVGGTDSYFFPEWLAALDRDWRLLCERNPDGFQPGEAAAFFLLEPPAAARRRGLAPITALQRVAAGRFLAAAGQPNTGAELATVLDQVLPPEGTTPPLVVCDLNGDSTRMREWGYALSRLGRRLEPGFALEHPAAVLGDVGAATGAMLVALATQYLDTKHAGRAGAVVWAGSDDGERRAVLLTRS